MSNNPAFPCGNADYPDTCYFFSFLDNGAICSMNDIFLHDLGYTRDEIIHLKKINELLTTGSMIFFQTQFYPLVKLQGSVNEVFLYFKTSAGAEIPVLLNIKMITRDGHAEMYCGGLSISNRSRFETEIINARHIAEKALLENEELVRLKNELHENQFLLEHRARQQNHHYKENLEINAVLSHDLQEPLRKVSIFTNKLMGEYQSLPPDKILLYLEKINIASKKMRRMIVSIQDYLNLEKIVPFMTESNLSVIIEGAKQQSVLALEKQSLRFQIDVKDDLSLRVDRNLMIILFKQLLNNSAAFSNPANEFLKISITAEIIRQNIFKEIEGRYQYDEYVRIIYTDNGKGFDVKSAEYIFELFRKADSSEGLGFGLTYCRKIMQLHHGTITAFSAGKNGATFTLMLPANII